MEYWVYLACCGDNTLYTGATTDLKRRMREHNGESTRKQGAKYTASHLPVFLAQAWAVDTWSDALRLEYAIKRCRRGEKIRLIEEPWEIKQIAEKRKLTFRISIVTQEITQQVK
ncbi:GIY-YIG nuclease family protein [Desulfosporosinus sp. PR]|uniref:GIY-YIG nuclease family protein n=1 Tax=Candidatus Desulfosporosinus nitrosoreducens TaxID=3401928 RepID=UPI0027FB64E5|nr:GIY-YIG nuclease family protein [Desulfosporosinus sp. PR]MDQ7096027.1 GIY-YIG nuclease family protein [Desulfosporosinus sp. PR]